MSDFIDRLAPIAIKYGKAAGVLPSLILAQGILESASGTSELAVRANNLFGIKRDSGWSGEVYSKDSKEWSADRGWYSAISEFRKYPSYAECVDDLLHKYTHGLTWESHNRYAAVIGEKDAQKAAYAVFNAGYATDPTYPEKLIRVIEQHDLTQYDEGVNSVVKKVAIDAGHGMNTAGKRTPAGEREWSFNNTVVRAAIAELNTYSDVDIIRLDDSTGRTDVPLKTRTSRANAFKADVLVSVHHNAMTGRWGNHGGVETFTYTPVSRNPKSKALADKVHPKIVRAMGLSDRGIKGGNLHMVREFKGPAILTEGGFMDSNIDIKALRNDAKLKAQGVAIAQGIAEYLGLKKKAGQSTGPATPAAPFPSNVIGTVEAVTPTLNVRSGPGTSHKILKAIKPGTAYRAYGTENGWYSLGGNQWVSGGSSYVRFTPNPAYNAPKPEVSGNSEEKDVEKLELSTAQRKEIANNFKTARERGVFSSENHEKEILDGTMTQSRLLYLNNLIATAALIGGERNTK